MDKKTYSMFILLFPILLLNPVVAECGNIGIGVFGGYAWSIEDDAIDSWTLFEYDELGNGGVIGGSLTYRFNRGFGLELVVENYQFDLKENGEDAGTLKMTPLMLLFVYQGIPADGKGLAGHGSIGSGINFTSFSKGPYIEKEEQANNSRIDIDPKNSFIFEVGGGLDYFFDETIEIFLDARFLFCDVDVDDTVSSNGYSSEYGIDTFYTSNIQALIGIRFWF